MITISANGDSATETLTEVSGWRLLTLGTATGSFAGASIDVVLLQSNGNEIVISTVTAPFAETLWLTSGSRLKYVTTNYGGTAITAEIS